jgi:histidinol-phosphate aminotransferase
VSAFASSYDGGVEANPDDILCLHRNENLFVGRDWTVDAAQQMVASAHIASYPEMTSLVLREALAEHYGVQPGNIFVGNGADEVLSDLFNVLHPHYDALHVLDVRFKVYDLLAERLDFRLEIFPGNAFETGRIDTSGFSGLAVVDSPNAISGGSVAREDLDALAATPDSYLIWDNVYGEYAGDELPNPMPPNMAVVRSFSKYYGLAGLRIGYCIAHEDIVGQMLACKDAFNVNSFGQVMALEALRREDAFRAQCDELVAGRQALVVGLERLGFRVMPSDSVAVLVSHPGFAAKTIQQELLKREIAVRHFTDEATANFVRITASPAATQDRLLAALAEIVSR